MRKLISIVLLITLYINVVSIYGIFKIQQAKIRREIKRQIKRGVKEEDLHIFHFNQEEFENLNWVKSNEFQLAKKFYDVVRCEKIGTEYKLYCIDDQQETLLFSKLDELVRSRTRSDNNSSIVKQLINLKAYYSSKELDISARHIDIHHFFLKLHSKTTAGFPLQSIKPPTYSTI